MNPVTITLNTLCKDCQDKIEAMMANSRFLVMDNATVKKNLCKKCLKGYRKARKYYNRK